MDTRRGFLKIIGGTTVILAAGGGGWAATRDPKKARAPWQEAGLLYDDPIRNALSYAILAPNPHNRQPWLVDLKSDSEAVLYCQLDRRLPETDPFNRQITIGLGCFLETLRIAASSFGYSAQITPFPEGGDEASLDARPVAHIVLEENNTAADPLFSAILNRHTDRSAYDLDRPVVAPALEKVLSAGQVEQTASAAITDPGMVTKLRGLTWRAWVIETETPQTHMETVNLMRIGRREIEAQPDGLALGGPMLEALNVVGIITREKLADPASTAFQQTVEFMRPPIETAMGYVTVKTNSNSRRAQIAAGGAYVRLNLQANALGVSMHPLSQALQEYPEMADPFREIHDLLASSGETIQMLARIGYGKGEKPSARWPLTARLQQ